MNIEIDIHTSTKGTKLIEGDRIEQTVVAAIRKSFDLRSYKVGLFLVEPANPNPRSESSLVSLRRKMRLANELGILKQARVFPYNTPLEEFNQAIDEINKSSDIAGVIVQLPLPQHLLPSRYNIDLQKDIDSINPENDIWRICATAEATMRLLIAYQNNIKKIALLGARGFVGRHIGKGIQRSQLGNLTQIEYDDSLSLLKYCDTIISAVGQPNLIQADNLGKNTDFGIDVGNTRVNNEFKGDFDYKSIDGLFKYLTPVPGGMGPLEMVIVAERLVRNAIQPDFKVNLLAK
ncbi:bifunctional 5,10-methylenetetrahydrofolate dehydrogenase/5,10-methenyltetrahydrofolate cyclohydrolase [Candidatus Daviesbacteria bacterium]|nr:bifunctional 5,10-methylenetetrahydrofolate dehydrogenase/5,10-methenyltetrahydrofolate cyclohydrolase [Candidatus Daviesbacteria bacterium]